MAQKIRPGDVLAIPIDGGRFVFGRVLKDASIAIYDFVSRSPTTLPPSCAGYLFIVGVYRDVLKSGQWPVIGRLPFLYEEEAWPPPAVVRDPISGKCRIYHKGHMRSATSSECEGLEPAAVWDKEHIINRIMQAGILRD